MSRLFIASCALLSGGALAQEPMQKRVSALNLQDIASALGEAHAIRTLCSGEDDQTWRAYMMELMDLEATDPASRSRLIRAFNVGYKAQRNVHEVCSDALLDVESEIAGRGRAAAEVAARTYLEREPRTTDVVSPQ